MNIYTLTDFFWNFYAKLELVKVNNVHLEVTVFCRQFCQEAQIVFWWNHLIHQWWTLFYKTKTELPIIEYNMSQLNRAITKETTFLNNHLQNVVGKLFPDPFLKKSKLNTLILLHAKLKAINLLKINCKSLALTSKSFKKQKRSGTSFFSSLSPWSLKKNISHVIVYYLTKFYSPYFVRYSVICV